MLPSILIALVHGMKMGEKTCVAQNAAQWG